MQRLITTRDVAEYLKVADSPTFEPHIDQAQGLAVGYIKAKSLDVRSDVELTKALDEWTEIIVVRDGPIGVVNSVEVDGEELEEDDYTVNPWTVELHDVTGSSVTINYNRGYSTTTLPDDLKRALISIAAKINRQPNIDVVYKAEKIGDYTLTEQHAAGVPGGGTVTAFPPEITTVLNRYRKPQIA